MCRLLQWQIWISALPTKMSLFSTLFRTTTTCWRHNHHRNWFSLVFKIPSELSRKNISINVHQSITSCSSSGLIIIIKIIIRGLGMHIICTHAPTHRHTLTNQASTPKLESAYACVSVYMHMGVPTFSTSFNVRNKRPPTKKAMIAWKTQGRAQ